MPYTLAWDFSKSSTFSKMFLTLPCGSYSVFFLQFHFCAFHHLTSHPITLPLSYVDIWLLSPDFLVTFSLYSLIHFFLSSLINNFLIKQNRRLVKPLPWLIALARARNSLCKLPRNLAAWSVWSNDFIAVWDLPCLHGKELFICMKASLESI